MSSTQISDLIPDFQPAVRELLEKGRVAGIPNLRITCTTRTYEEQVELYKKGYSKTLKSKHLTGEAVDFYVKDYNMDAYNKLYELSRSIPKIVWPYRDYGWGWDAPHYEYRADKSGSMEGGEAKMTNDEAWDIANAGYEVLFGRSLTETEGHERTWAEVREIQRLGPKAGNWLRNKAKADDAKVYRLAACPPPKIVEIPVEKIVEREVKVPIESFAWHELLIVALKKMVGLIKE